MKLRFNILQAIGFEKQPVKSCENSKPGLYQPRHTNCNINLRFSKFPISSPNCQLDSDLYLIRIAEWVSIPCRATSY